QRDMELFFEVVLGAEPSKLDPYVIPTTWKLPDLSSTKIKVGVMYHDGYVLPHPPMLRGLKTAAQKLAENPQFEVVEYSPFEHQRALDIARELYFPDGTAKVHEMLEATGEAILPLTEHALAPPFCKDHSVLEMYELMGRRDAYRKEHLKHWMSQGIDVLLCPAFPGTAQPHDTARYWSYTSQWNLVDYPGIVWPSGLYVDAALDPVMADFTPMSPKDEENMSYYNAELMMGSPISLQLVSRKFNDSFGNTEPPSLPDWLTDLPRYSPFLFPFDTRHIFFQSTAFDYGRLMQKWVFKLYGSSRASLEVKFFSEVGSGLGPTLEFYAVVSKEFARKDLSLWRDTNAAGRSSYVLSPAGLSPRPLDNATTEAGKKVLKVFRVSGQFVAKALMDSRIIDVHFGKAFMKMVVECELPLKAPTLMSFDKEMGRSLSHLRNLEEARRTPSTASRSTVSDLMLDFTLPGYNIELKAGGGDVAVNMWNLEEYISLVVNRTLLFPACNVQSFTASELVMMTRALDEDWSVEGLTKATQANHGFTMDRQPVCNLLSNIWELTIFFFTPLQFSTHFCIFFAANCDSKVTGIEDITAIKYGHLGTEHDSMNTSAAEAIYDRFFTREALEHARDSSDQAFYAKLLQVCEGMSLLVAESTASHSSRCTSAGRSWPKASQVFLSIELKFLTTSFCYSTTCLLIFDLL
ncbi:E3 ubiquitin-protein ligase TRIP12, partial [Pseudohyphozyma bogoriensis]